MDNLVNTMNDVLNSVKLTWYEDLANEFVMFDQRTNINHKKVM